jgi:hypothetical protein
MPIFSAPRGKLYGFAVTFRPQFSAERTQFYEYTGLYTSPNGNKGRFRGAKCHVSHFFAQNISLFLVARSEISEFLQSPYTFSIYLGIMMEISNTRGRNGGMDVAVLCAACSCREVQKEEEECPIRQS